MQNYMLKFNQKHYKQKQRSQAKKLWKSSEDHQKLKLQALKNSFWRNRQTLKSSEAEDYQKLHHQNLKQKEFTSLKTWQDQNQWLKNNLLKGSVISIWRNIRLYNVNLIHKWSVFEDCSIVLLLLKMIEWYFKYAR